VKSNSRERDAVGDSTPPINFSGKMFFGSFTEKYKKTSQKLFQNKSQKLLQNF